MICLESYQPEVLKCPIRAKNYLQSCVRHENGKDVSLDYLYGKGLITDEEFFLEKL